MRIPGRKPKPVPDPRARDRITVQRGEFRVVSPDTLNPQQRANYEAAMAEIRAAQSEVHSDAPATPVFGPKLTAQAWYQVGGDLGAPPLGLFVVLVGDNPVGRAPFIYDRLSKQLVNGADVCSRYLSFGDPGATEISEQRASDLLETMGGSMAAVTAQFAELATLVQYPDPGPVSA
jgi:hypothetical protein